MASLISSVGTFALVWIGLWQIPGAISDSKGHVLSGFLNRKIAAYMLLTFAISSLMILSQQTISLYAGIKILMLTLLPFGSALMMRKYYYLRQ